MNRTSYTFEQCAGFLRIQGGDEPLDASSVHPEAYPVVERIRAQCGREIHQFIGDASLLRALKPEQLTDERFGLPTVRDIIRELENPGRDPRPEFRVARFSEGIEDLRDLKPGMILEGVVTNVAAFGAFVHVGVHQDDLVHVSALSERFIKDPREAVKAGDIVKGKVMEVDLPRERIALSCRLSDEPGVERAPRGAPNERPRGSRDTPRGSARPDQTRSSASPANNALSEALARAKRG